MLIVSKIQRKGGSRVTVRGSEYIFEPRGPKGEHVAEVEDREDIAAFLAVPEGFAPYDLKEATDLMPKAAPEQRLEDAVEPDDGASDEDEGEDDPEAALENDVEPDQDDGLAEMGNLDLAHAYKDEFNAMPRKNMKRETIIRHIRKARAETGG